MPVEIRVPQMGESVTEATVLRWMKQAGESVTAGEAIAELETDKVNVEVPADQSGTLQEIVHQAGDTVAVGDVLAIMGEAAAPTVASNGASATPLARTLAEDHKVDLAQVKGSGPGGRVQKDDVTSFVERASPPPLKAPPTPLITASVASSRPEERVPMSRRRQTIATRLVEAQHTAAMLTTFNELDMSAVMAIRAKRKDSFKEKFGVGLGFMSFFSKATIGALKAFPLLNAEIQGLEIVKKAYYDIGIAVGAEEGLVVPVVRDADKLTFAQIEKQIGDLAKRARENTLTLPELQGGTFTITNGGVFGSLLSTPILNGPQVGILGLHKIEERPIAKNGKVVIKPMMYVALSYDHRIVDGGEAVRFLVKIKELIEDPETLLLEG